jgi:potassium-dependent mechanosensitive channel
VKRLLPLLLLAAALAGAEIDTKLYEGPGKEAYYGEVKQAIDKAQAGGTLSNTRADEERAELKRLRQAAEPPAPVEQDPAALLKETSLRPGHFYHALETAATVGQDQKNIEGKLRDIQSKLSFLKQKIEHITEEERPFLRSFQLQFAYYKLQQQNLETRSGQLQQYQQAILSAMQSRLGALPCGENAVTLKAQLAKADAVIDRSLQQKVAAAIALEHGELEDSTALEKLRQARDAANAHYDDQLEQKLALQSKLALCRLQEKNDNAFFALLDEISATAAHLSKEKRGRYAEQVTVLRMLAKTRLGVTTVVLGDTLHEAAKLFEKIVAVLSAPLFVYKEHAVSVFSLLKSLLILIFGFYAGNHYKRWVGRLSKRWPDMSQMSLRLATNIGYYIIIGIAALIAISSLGFDMSSISLIAGALSIGVGFGLQTVVSNLFAGIILMFERTIRIGDTIEISDVLLGRVTDMRIRSTTVKTFDNIDIVVPNSSFIQNNVINWTLDDITRRLHIPFDVAYGTDVDAVKSSVLTALHESELTFIRDDPEKQPDVWMVSLGNNGVNFELIIWIEWANKLRPNALRSDFLILIYKALNASGITIPFPQLDLYVKQLPKSDASTPPTGAASR